MARYANKRDMTMGKFEPCDDCPTPGECRREGRCRLEAMTQSKKRALREATRKGMISEGERRMMQKIMK